MIGSPEREKYGETALVLAGVCAAALALSACAHQPQPDGHAAPGFFAGLRDGFLILFSLLAGLFSDVRIYAFPNSGYAYDAGYFLGAASFLGGGVCGNPARRRKTPVAGDAGRMPAH